MSKIKVTLPDNSVREYDAGATVKDVAFDISPRLGKAALAGKINGVSVDLSKTIEEDAAVEIITFDSDEGKHIFRHSAAHIMAQAVKRLFPEAKLAFGPAIENGFYYDFDLPRSLTPDDLEKIEAEMKKIVKEKYGFEHRKMSKQEAIKMEKERGEVYKVEFFEELEDDTVSFYAQGEFSDLCTGPHIPHTGYLKAFKLMKIAGAYWRGDEKREMLQRIYGTAFDKQSKLDAYLEWLEEAAKRDHRKLGKELDLFSILEEGPGFPFFHPKGMVIRNGLEDFWRQAHVERGYQEVKTPIILNEQLWHTSGHWDHYKENMYFTKIDEEDYAVKPMNCPGGMLMYKRRLHSYRDLPVRVGELGLVHRHEMSGALHGLMRVRCFTQDDAHIFMRPDQIKEEIVGVIDFIDYVYNVFGFNYHVELSTRPEDAMGSDQDWETATTALEEALQEKGMDYIVNEGDGAFYGPKIDFHLEDSLGRTWQCGTIQLDFQMPERFDLTYVGQDGEKHRPVMIHRVIFGSIERFIGILTEHYAGAFPAWLAPVQVKVIPIAERHQDYAQKVADQLMANDIRVEIDARSEKVGYKIREAQMQKNPYMLIVGDQEEENGTVGVRKRSEGDIGAMELDKFITDIIEEIKEKK